MQAAFDLWGNISKYLKEMDFVKTSSPLTLRSYWSDLRQAFQIPKEAVNPDWGTQKQGNFISEGAAFRTKGPSFSEEQLLQQIRRAFSEWAPLSLASRNRKAATLKSFFSWAYEQKLTQKNLAEKISCPKVPRRLPHFLSLDEVMSLLGSFDGEVGAQALREKALMLLLYGGGLRISEACNLEWRNFDPAQRLLRIRGKGSKERLMPVPEKVVAALTSLQLANPDSDFVFGDYPLPTREAYDWVRTRGQKAGLLHQLHPHALRHSYATHLLSGGANLRTLQKLLGHESLQATEKYTHLGIDQLARTLEKHHPLGARKIRRA